ncbi:MAG: DUF3027 domain-containing protein [Pseudonocardia sp.]
MVDLTPDTSAEVALAASPDAAPDASSEIAPDVPPVADPRLVAAAEQAREAALAETEGDPVGQHIDTQVEDDGSVTHFFAAELTGYRGWRWAVTVAHAGPDTPVTVSEVVLLPGPDALVAPAWLPWQERVRAGDLGVGDLLPTEPDDPRLAPGYLASDDPAVEEVALEVGLGRRRVLSLDGRLDAAVRWWAGEHGPDAEMARSAPAACGTCGFLLPLAGSMRGVFGVCGNEYSPADGTVVGVEYGCGAHSDVAPDPIPATPVAELIYDDGVDVETVDNAVAADAADDVAAVDETAVEPADEIAVEIAVEPVVDEPGVEPAVETVDDPAVEAAVDETAVDGAVDETADDIGVDPDRETADRE